MKVISQNRNFIYDIARISLRQMHTSIIATEIGVLRGDNAKKIIDILAPNHIFLIDAWSTDAFLEYKYNNQHRNWVKDLDEFKDYFGGSVYCQKTLDQMHDFVVERFKNNTAVSIIRSTTRSGISEIPNLLNGELLNYIYLDANHQYETVLDDLIECEKILHSDGLIQLNDCCFSVDGIAQNLGVLEATTNFCKRFKYTPLLVTNNDFTDILLCKSNSRIVGVVDYIINEFNVSYVELPSSLLGALTVRHGAKHNLSFL